VCVTYGDDGFRYPPDTRIFPWHRFSIRLLSISHTKHTGFVDPLCLEKLLPRCGRILGIELRIWSKSACLTLPSIDLICDRLALTGVVSVDFHDSWHYGDSLALRLMSPAPRGWSSGLR
jgi:hypothetical protein